jgi:nucleoside-diphosphate-sugar epimerase
MIQQGAPVIILMPGVVYGPGDTSLFGQLMEAWYRGLFPIFPGPETAFSFAHIDDIVQGHMLAIDQCIAGDCYIITGPVKTFNEMVNLWASITGKPAPIGYLPARFLHPFAPVSQVLSALIPSFPELLSRDAIRMMGATYAATAEKARASLGWHTRPLEEGMRQTLEWIARKTEAEPLLTHQRRQAS